jgi:hypothetical protein
MASILFPQAPQAVDGKGAVRLEVVLKIVQHGRIRELNLRFRPQ